MTGYWARGQLALQTMIFYDVGRKTVLHQWVPPLQPLDVSDATEARGINTPDDLDFFRKLYNKT